MHGANQNHLVNAVHFNLENATVPGLASYDVPAVVVLGLGRDTNWGTGPAEMDLLEMTDDAIARLGLDAERIVLSGISAGGIGTFRHLARHPDKWTGGYSIVGGGTEVLENMTNVPLRFHNGTFDPLVNVQFYLDAEAAADAAGTVDYRGALVNTSSHLPEQAGNCWYLEMLSRPRAVNPPRVRYTTQPSELLHRSGRRSRPAPGRRLLGVGPRVERRERRLDRRDQPARRPRARRHGHRRAGAGEREPGPRLLRAESGRADQGRVGAARALVRAGARAARVLRHEAHRALTNAASVSLDVARAGLVPEGQTAGDWDGDGVPARATTAPTRRTRASKTAAASTPPHRTASATPASAATYRATVG